MSTNTIQQNETTSIIKNISTKTPLLVNPPQTLNDNVSNNITFNKRKRKRKKKSKQIMNQNNDTLSSNINNNNNDTNYQLITSHKIKKRRLNENYQSNIIDKTKNKINYIKSDKLIESQNTNHAAVEVYKPDEEKKSLIELGSDKTKDGHTKYRGLKNYKNKPKVKAPKFLGIGPQRAPDNIKITCYFDYQPDICKDWKETGFCGYGQSCKFLHDRSDYKAGWQIDNEWKKQQKLLEEIKKGNLNPNNNDDINYEIHSSDEDNIDNKLPFACFICKNKFKNPVKTQCNHYFCSKCAFKRYRKKKTCACCGMDTDGIFIRADKLINKIKEIQSQ